MVVAGTEAMADAVFTPIAVPPLVSPPPPPHADKTVAKVKARIVKIMTFIFDG